MCPFSSIVQLKELIMANLTQIPFKKVDGSEASLSNYQGKVLLLVNVASKCGLTPQYEGLEGLYEKYKAQGLEVVGFPANNFLGQEPGSDAEIQEFCKTNFNVQFPVMSKISVVGDDQHPLYAALTSEIQTAENNGDNALRDKLAGLGQVPAKANDILWNFEKFLIDRNGKVVGRFASNIAPTDAVLTQAIEKELAKEPVRA
jgi:glutathione peroxidase